MSEVFYKLHELTNRLYDKSLGIIVEEGSLLLSGKTNRIFVLFKIRNIAKSAVKTVQIVVTAYDSRNNAIEKQEYAYSDLQIGQNDEFGNRTPLLFTDKATKYRIKSFSVTVSKITTTDGAMLESNCELTNIPTPTPLFKYFQTGIFVEEYKFNVCKDAKYLPSKEDDLWLCTCGNYNHTDESACLTCNTSFEKQKEFLDKETIEVLAKKHQTSQTYDNACYLLKQNKVSSVKKAIVLFRKLGDWGDSPAKLEYCKEILPKLVQIKNEKAKKIKFLKIIAVAVSCLAIVSMIGLLIVNSNNKKLEKYNTALACLNSDEIETAYELFENLGDFKDSKEYLSKYSDAYKSIKNCDFKINEDGNYSVSLKNKDCKSVIIPSTYLGKPVTEIMSFTSREIRNITIPDTITSISDDAFLECYALQYNEYDNAYYLGNDDNPYTALIKAKDTLITSCTIGDKTKLIYDNAFNGCKSLKNITVGSNVTSIGDCAFKDCNNLKSITVGTNVTSIGKDAFKNCSELKGVYITDIAAWCAIEFGASYSNPLTYAENLYLNNELVTDLVIPNTVTAVKHNAFNGAACLYSVIIPDGIASIGDNAFYNCSGLTTITIPDTVISIGDYAFYNCTNFTSLTLGRGVTAIGERAFYTCRKLSEITIPATVTSIGRDAFSGCINLKSIRYTSTMTKWRAIDNKGNWLYAGQFTVYCTDGKIDKINA